MKPGDVLLPMVLQFALLSLIAVGGANAVVPEMHRFFVESRGWLGDAEFADLFALAQAAPGPNVMIVGLIGWRLAGFGGAVLATVAMCGPSGVLTYAVGHVWHRFRGRPWRAAVQAGLAPLTVGLILASGWILARAADHGWAGYAVTAVAAIAVLTTKLHPLWLLAAAGVLGALGLV